MLGMQVRFACEYPCGLKHKFCCFLCRWAIMLPGISELFFGMRSCPAESTLDKSALVLILFQLLVDMTGDVVSGFVLSRGGIDIGRVQRMSSASTIAADVVIAATFGSMGLAMTDTCLFGGLFRDYKDGEFDLQKFAMKIGPGGSDSLKEFLHYVFGYAFCVILAISVFACLTQRKGKSASPARKNDGCRNDSSSVGSSTTEEDVPPGTQETSECRQNTSRVHDDVKGLDRPTTPPRNRSASGKAMSKSAASLIRARRWTVNTRASLKQTPQITPASQQQSESNEGQTTQYWGPEWVACWDESCNRRYWYNTETRESMWDSEEQTSTLRP
eukprot:SAG31_NODE_1028_length_10273_cov_22.700413_6_plen_330_part_00